MYRRALLTSIGATSLSAGCLSPIENRFEPSVRLGWLAAHNFDTEPHLFELKVERDGTKVHYSSHEIEPREGDSVDGEVAECDWGSTPGNYTVFVRVDGGGWVAESVTEYAMSMDSDVDCVIADADNRDGRLGWYLSNRCDGDHTGICPFTNR